MGVITDDWVVTSWRELSRDAVGAYEAVLMHEIDRTSPRRLSLVGVTLEK